MIELAIIEDILTVLSTLIISIVIVVGVIELLFNHDCVRGVTIQLADMSGTLFFVLLMIALICFYINCIVLTSLLFNKSNIQNNKHHYFQCLIWSKLPYEIGVLSMHLFFIFRLHFVFKESALKVNKSTFYILIILEIIAFSSGCIDSVIGPYLYIFKPNWFDPTIYINCLALSISLMVDITVTVSFLERLFKVTVSLNVRRWKWRKRSLTLSMEMNERRSSNFAQYVVRTPMTSRSDYTMEAMLATQQISMVHVITKNTLLCSIGLTSSFLIPLTKTIVSIILIHTMDYVPEKESIRAFSSFDGSINIICMYLMFTFSRKQYNYLCKSCHNAIGKCCIWCTKKTVKQNRTDS